MPPKFCKIQKIIFCIAEPVNAAESFFVSVLNHLPGICKNKRRWQLAALNCFRRAISFGIHLPADLHPKCGHFLTGRVVNSQLDFGGFSQSI